jgi:NAD(P)H-dependent flavin oxidoreductase YrpB (nitropropane dioxygenase family)
VASDGLPLSLPRNGAHSNVRCSISFVTILVLTSVVAAVHPTPMIVASGMANGQGLTDVLALGASGAMLGTGFSSRPRVARPTYKQTILAATEADTLCHAS